MYCCGFAPAAMQYTVVATLLPSFAPLISSSPGSPHLSSHSMPDARSCHRLEPVAVGVSTVVDGPVEDGGRDDVGVGLGPGGIVEELG